MPQAKVMVVDDDDVIRMVLAAYLEDEGYEPLTAADGEEALAMLSSVTAQVAVVDFRLPGMDGRAFITKAHHLNPNLHFIIHTGSGDDRIPQTLAEFGVTPRQVFRKPITDMEYFGRVLAELTDTDMRPEAKA